MTGTLQSQPDTSRQFLEVRNPADGSIVERLPIHDANDVSAIATALRAAQPEWEALGPHGRAKHLLAWLDWIMDHEDRLRELLQTETGKSWGDTTLETAVAVDVINYATKHAAEWLADAHVKPVGLANATKRLRVFARPYPLVGVITPWNMPFGMPMLDIPFALVAGAAVLSKPSEVAPLTWVEAVRGWEQIGAPPVLACALGAAATGEAVVDTVDMVQFTGSVRTGRAIAVRSAGRLIPCSLELGGKDPMIVLEDADVDRAVGAAVWGGLFNSGQACISVERVYVHQDIYDEFVGKLTAEVSRIRQGTDLDKSFNSDIGAMATPTQVDIVDRHVTDAQAKGARVLVGGTRAGVGSYYTPTVLVDVDHTMQCMREETFGPVLPIMKVPNDEEAIRLANDSDYGLAGSVWTADAARGERVARRLETGGVCINNALAGVFQFPLPFGGWKHSGLGARFGGPNSVRKYCRHQAFVAERLPLKREPMWYPYTPAKGRLIGAAVRLLGMHDWRRRLGLRPKR